MAKKLQYFNLGGLAESLRYLLHYSGVEFEDIRYELADWPIQSVKDSLPYGQLPVYEEDGKTLNQSLAIARYIASKSNLLPSDLWEQAVLDAAVFNVYDFWHKAREFIYEREDQVRRAELMKKALADVMPYYLPKFEKELKAHNGHFGGKLSWADFIFVGIIECANFFFKVDIAKDYPTIAALVQEIQNLPGVKEYIAKRKPYVNNM